MIKKEKIELVRRKEIFVGIDIQRGRHEAGLIDNLVKEKIKRIWFSKYLQEEKMKKNFKFLICLLLIFIFNKFSFSEFEGTNLKNFFPYGVHQAYSDPTIISSIPIKNKSDLREAIEIVCKDWQQHNINAAFIGNTSPQHIDLWLEIAGKYNIKLIFQGGGFPMFIRPPLFGGIWENQLNPYKRKKDVISFWEGMAKKYKDNKNLLGWCLTEENPPDEEWAKYLKEIVDMMTKIDPNHPVFIVDNKVVAVEMNAEIIKPQIIMVDKYPFCLPHFGWWIGREFESKSYLEREFTRSYLASSKIGAVLWVIGFASKEGIVRDGLWYCDRDYPTEEQIYWQVWKALQYGVKGYFWYTYGSYNGESPEMGNDYDFEEGLRDRNFIETSCYKAVKKMGTLVKYFSPLLLELDIAPLSKDVIYFEQNPLVSSKTFIHRKTGSRYVIVVNDDFKNTQRIEFEVGYSAHMVKKEDLLIDIFTGESYNYNTVRLYPLLPGRGVIFFVGTEKEWENEKKAINWKTLGRTPSYGYPGYGW